MGKGAVSVASKQRTKVVSSRVTGKVVEWRGKFGWIKPTQALNHPAAAKRDGKLFLGQEDVEAELSGVGAVVSFFVYQDANGLGAMNVRPGSLTAQPVAKTTATAKKPTVSTFPGKTQGHAKERRQGKAQAAMQGKAQGKTQPKTPEKAQGNPAGAKPTAEAGRAPRTKVYPQRLLGKVKTWLGKFGWIIPTQAINHPMVHKHKGEVFVGQEDIEAELSGTGADVSFFLYSDVNGLGAMNVRPAGGPTQGTAAQKQAAGKETAKAPAKEAGKASGKTSGKNAGKAKAAPKVGLQKHVLQQKLKQKQQRERGQQKLRQAPDKSARTPVSTKPVRGRVVRSNGKVAFIKLDEKIDHPRAQKNLYLHANDVKGKFPGLGAQVTCTVYEDAAGLGAENCKAIASGNGKQDDGGNEKKAKADWKTKGGLAPKAKATATPKVQAAAGKVLPRKRVSGELAYGEIVDWKGTFGWVEPTVPVQDPGTKKEVEKIYCNAKDIAQGTPKEKGTLVRFFVYKDASGLGAEKVRAQ